MAIDSNDSCEAIVSHSWSLSMKLKNTVTIQIAIMEKYFPVVLFIMLNEVVDSFRVQG